MKKYKLSIARLVATTYGPAFTPDNQPPIHLLAENFDNKDHIKSKLADVRKTWLSSELTDPELAVQPALAALAAALNTTTSMTYSFVTQVTTYQPIYDAKGNKIGHELIPWLYLNGSPLKKEILKSGQLVLGMLGSVVVGVTEA